MEVDLCRPIVDAVSIGMPEALRDLETRAREVVAREIAPREHDDSDASAFAMTRALGEAGLLDACTALHVPSICLLREVVAESSGLADSMLALQGLGYGP